MAGTTLPGEATSLPEDKTIAFPGIDALFTMFDADLNEGSDFLIVTNVTKARFRRIDAERTRRDRKFRFHFRAKAHALWVMLQTWDHEVSHTNFEMPIVVAIMNAWGNTEWMGTGGATFTSADGSTNEADSSGRPRRGRSRTRQPWPSLIIRAGVTQSLDCLRTAMAWWFAESGHSVKIALLLKLWPAQRTIQIEKYTEQSVFPPAREGTVATRSRSVPDLVPVLQQTILISPVQGSQPERYSVTNGPLVLEQELLFLKLADPNQVQDIVVTDKELGIVAEKTWE